MLEIGCRPANSKVIPPQVLLLLFVEDGLDFIGVALVVEVQIIGGHIVLLDLVAASSPSFPDIEVTGLDRLNEVRVWLLNRLVCVGCSR